MTTGSIRRAGGTQRIPAPHSRHDAGKPLWDNRSVEFSLDSLMRTVADRAEPLGAISSPRPDERISSVLALLAPGPNGAEVLLTRRSSSLNNHSGEMSFPGGRVDEGESIIEAQDAAQLDKINKLDLNAEMCAFSLTAQNIMKTDDENAANVARQRKQMME